MKRSILTMAAACLAFNGGLAFAQDQDDAGDSQQQDVEESTQADQAGAASETVVTDAHRAVWSLMAGAAAMVGKLSPEQTESLTELYVDTRARFADAEDATRDEWREEMRQKLESQRAQGEVTGEIFDTTYLEKSVEMLLSRHRKQFAEALVKLLERETAETVYPLLGGFDKRTDGLVNQIMGFDLAEDAQLSATKAIQEFFVETVKARSAPPEQIALAVHAARQKFIGDLETLLTREQVQKVARKAGIPLNS